MKNAKRIIAVALVIVTVLACFTGCTMIQKAKIIGDWKDESGTYGATFNKDGSCSLNLQFIAAMSVDGTYEVSRNEAKQNVVTVTYKIPLIGTNSTAVWYFTIDKDILTITSDSGAVTTLYKQK